MTSPLDQLLVTTGNNVLNKADTLNKITEAKKEQLAKLSALNVPETAKNVVTGMTTGTGGVSMSPEEYDMRTMSNAQLVGKYGSQGLDLVNREVGYAGGASSDQDRLQNSIGNAQSIKDFGVGIGSGAVNIGLGLAQLGALATPWSSEVAGFSKDANEFMDSGLSNATLAERQMAQEERALSDRDNQQSYAEEGNYGLLGKTKRELSNLGDRLSNFGEYGLTDANVVANAVGSIGGIGLVTKGVAKAGGAVADKLLSEAGAKVAGKLGDAIRYPAIVGASEGGSAATDAINQMMEIPQATIEKHPEYQKLKESNPNLTHTDIVKQLAEQAGLTAAAITAPVAGALSLLTKGFNDKKLLPTAPSLSGVAGNAAKETLEEVPQSITGTIATNTSVKEYGDVNRDALKGTGQAAYDALIGSIGSTVGMQAPGGVAGSLTNASESISKSIEARSRSNPVNIAAKSVEVAATVAPQATQAVEETVKAVETGTVPQQDAEKAKAHADYTRKLTDTFSLEITNEDIDSVFESKPLREAFYGTKTLPEAVSRLADFVKRSDITPAERTEASLQMVQFMRQAQDVLLEGDDVLNTHGSYAPLKQYQSAMADNVKALIDSNTMTEDVAKATKQLYKNAITAGYITEVVPENLSNPATAAQETANLDKVVAVALSSDKLPEELKGTVSTILQMVEAGSANLSPKQVKTLETIAALYNESEAMQQDAVELGATGTAFVNNQVLQNTTEERDISGRKMGNRLSLRGHVNGILTALNAGDTTAYQTRLKRFKAFVVEHNAKADAVDTHLDKVTKGTLKPNERTPYGTSVSGKKGLYVNLNSEGSVANATAIQQEAAMLSRGYSRLLNAFGSEGDVKVYSLPTEFKNRKVNPQLSAQVTNPEQDTDASTTDTSLNTSKQVVGNTDWDTQRKVLEGIRAAKDVASAESILEKGRSILSEGNAARATKLIEGKKAYAKQQRGKSSNKVKKLHSPESLLKQGTFYGIPVEDVEIFSKRNKPVGARNTGSTLQFNSKILKEVYEAKGWTVPAILRDGSKAEPLDVNEFNSFEEFFTFVMLHERAHSDIKINKGETRGSYETRINNAALEQLNKYDRPAKQQVSSPKVPKEVLPWEDEPSASLIEEVSTPRKVGNEVKSVTQDTAESPRLTPAAQKISQAVSSPKGLKSLLDTVDMTDEAEVTSILDALVDQESSLKDEDGFEEVTDFIINTLDKLVESKATGSNQEDFYGYMGNSKNQENSNKGTNPSVVESDTETVEPKVAIKATTDAKETDPIKIAIGGNLAFGRDNAFYSGFTSKAKGAFALLGSNPLSSLKELLGVSSAKLKNEYGSKSFAGLNDALLMLYREVFNDHVPMLVKGFRNQLQEAINKGNLTDAVGKAKGTGLTSIATILASELSELDSAKQSTAIRRAINTAMPSLNMKDAKAVKAFTNTLRSYVNVSAEKTMLDKARKKILDAIQAQEDEDILIQESLNKKAENDESMRKVSEASLQGKRMRNTIYGEGLKEKLRLFDETHGKRVKEVGDTYMNLTANGSSFMNNIKALRTALVDEFKKGNISKDTLVIRKELNTVPDGKAFAFADVTWSADKNGNVNASLDVNQGLVETGAIGALQWLIHKSAIGKHEGLDKSEVAKIMGISEDDVTPILLSSYNNKHSVADMISDMGRFMQNALEVKEQSGNNYIGDTQGTLSALASTFLDVMANDDAFGVTFQDLSSENVNTTLMMADLNFGVVVSEDKYRRPVRESVFKGFTDLLNPLLGNPPSDNVFIGSPDEIPVAKTVLRSDVGLTEEQIAVVEKANKVKFRIHEPMRKLFNTIGSYGLVQIAGNSEVAPDRVNVNTMATREGQNLQLTAAFEHMQNIFAKVADYAKGTNQEETDVGVYYPNVFVSTARLMQQSPAAPQSSKPIRAVVSSTIRDVDLTNPEQLKLFNIALAQGLGVKVHNMDYPKVEKELTKLLEKPEVVQLIRALKDIENKGEASDRAIAKIQEGYSSIGGTLWGLSSIVEYRRYKQAELAGTLSNFRTNAAIEADGMTNGTANALHIMLGHTLTAKDVTNWIRTGYYVGSGNTTTNIERTKDSTDIYTAVSSAMQDTYAEHKILLRNELKRSISEGKLSKFATKVARRFLSSDLDKMYAFIEEYSPNVSIDRDKGTVSFKRNFSKQPVTVSVYGAQLNTMIEYILQDIMDSIYGSISGHLDGTDIWNQDRVNKFNDRIYALSTTTLSIGQFGVYFGYRKKGNDLDFNPYVPKLDLHNLDTFRQFTMRGQSEEFLQFNVKNLIASAFDDALTEVFGTGLMESINAVITATSVHAAIISAAFNYTVENVALESAEGMRKVSSTKFITGKQLREVIQGVTDKFSGVYEGNNQRFLISDKEGRSDLAKGAVGASLSGKFASYVRVRSLVPVGVKGAPVLNIGNGDASMIQNFIATLQNDLDALYVYDGIEFAITDVLENSVAINEAVFKTWSNNNVPRQIHNSFKFIPELMRPEYVTPELLELIAFASKSQPETYKGLVKKLHRIADNLGEMADVVDKRQAAIKEYEASVHQMASVEAPYVHKGKKFKENTPQGIAEEINAIVYGKNYKALEEPNTETDRVVIVEDAQVVTENSSNTSGSDNSLKPIKSFINDLDKELDNPNRDDKRLIVLVKRLYELSKGMLKDTQIAIANDAAEAIQIAKDSGLLNESELENFTTTVSNPSTKALYVFPANFIVVLKNKGELSSVAHEIIHAATFAELKLAYGKDNTLDMRTRDGKIVKQLEMLMQEFISDEFRTDIRNKDLVTSVYSENAVEVIKSYLSQNKTAEAVAEYMAYVLSDNRLAKAASDRKGKYSLVKAGKLVIEFIKSILGIPKESTFLNNMLESLEFHTLLLTDSGVTRKDNGTTVALEQRTPRIATNDLLNKAFARIEQLEEGVKKKNEQLAGVFNRLVEHANQDVDNLVKLGFYMDSDEAQLYSIVSGLVQANLIEDSKVLNQLTELYQLAVRELTLNDFSDVEVNTVDDAIAAQDMYNVMVSERGLNKNSSSFARFVGLLAASEPMQKAVSNLMVRSSKATSNDVVDKLVNVLGDKVTNAISGNITGIGSDVGAKLIEKLLSLHNVNSVVNAATNNVVTSELSTYNRLAAKFIQDYSVKFSTATMDSVAGLSKRNPIRAVVENIGASFGLLNETASESVATSLNTWVAKLKGYDPVKDLLSDLIGRIEDNASIYDLIKPVKTFVAKTRQAYKVEVPTKLLEAFKRKLSKPELHNMTRVLAKSGIYHIGNARAINVLLGKEDMESVIESSVNTLNQYYNKDELEYILGKSGQLAEFNMTGKAGNHLLRNAYAIASLLGSDNQRVMDFNTRQSKSIIRAINTLIGVGSYDYLNDADLSMIRDLIRDGRDGVNLMLSYLEGISARDTDKILSSPEATYNHYFGYLNQTATDGSHLTVVSDTQEATMRAQGYTRLQDYKGDSRDTIQGTFGYYYRAASPMNTFNQGIIQNIEATVAGVSRSNGFSVNNTVGVVSADGVLKDISNGVYKDTNEDLIPVYGYDGSIISYERTMDYTLVNKIPVEMDITKVLGTTRGRQVEEVAAEAWNAKIIETMNQDYEDSVDKSNYIDLLDGDSFKDDPVYAESISIFSTNFKEMVHAMGSKSLYARKETVREVIGYRKASLTDSFTGRSRLPKGVQKSIKDITMFMFGKDAFNYVSYAEGAVLEGVQLVKTVIAVKSIVVPIANILGNLIHLASVSVNMVNAAKRVPVFLTEVEQYHRNQKRIVDIEMELTTNPSVFVVKKLNAELRSIEASNKRMKIYPLIEAGELSGVNDAGNLDGELPFISTTSGKFRETVERWVDQTPEGIKVVGRQLFIAKNTALFRGLQKTVMYGDFIAKAILYYDLLDKGTPVKEIKARVQEEFVNYDKLAGRTRDALESFGLLWFYNFKLRSIKIALSMLRRNPLYALTLGLGVSEPTNMGTAFTDNALGLVIRGDLGYSIGVEMGINGMGMNPYHTLIN